VSANKKLIITYAKALFQSVQVFEGLEIKDTFKVSDMTSSEDKENKEDNTFEPNVYIIGEELLLLRATIQSSKSLKDFFKNPTYLEAQKLDILFSIFPGLTVITCSFLKVLTERSHLSLIPEITQEYTRLISKVQKSTKVKLILANMLQENYGALLLNTLRKVTDSKEIVLNVSYSSQLLGGLIIEYKSTSIDASLLKEFGLFFSDI
jgi:ATP synthase F1 delta subunit